ncbi:MAG: glucose-6-phosphate isomerase [Bacteroidales bacterium]
MNIIQPDLSSILNFISERDISAYKKQIRDHYTSLYNRTGKGSEFLGWIDLPQIFSTDVPGEIQSHAASLKDKADVFVVIGIGGSYLGARAVIEALSHHFGTLHDKKRFPLVLYAGQNLSEDYLADLMDVLDQKDYAVSVISKSGTTTEPALAFRIIKNHIEKKYGKEEARKRIIAITDKQKGALRKLAEEEHYRTFVVPGDVGGRYSVLTPVGLFPVAMAGMDIRELLHGALDMATHIRDKKDDFENNPASLYAAARNALYRSGRKTEILVSYEPRLFHFSEWWKQLFGESEGKEHKGIFPAAVTNTTDLHSMGQYIQDGERNLFETVLSVKSPTAELGIPSDADNLDELNYIAGKRIHEVNLKAEQGTTLAHIDGGVPNFRINIPFINEYSLGQLIYFFEMSCAISGYILGVNPFNQPGVEAYKRNMFALLGKPGFEKETGNLKRKD